MILHLNLGPGVLLSALTAAGLTDCDPTLQQNIQMCTRMTQKCDMVNEQVCQQVPMRVPVPGKKMVPQPPRWEMKCEDITEVSQDNFLNPKSLSYN